MTTLALARLRVLRLADDEDAVRHNVDGAFTEVDEALAAGQEQAWAAAVLCNGELFAKETTTLSTSSAGVCSLTSIAPMTPLVSVAQYTTGRRDKIVPARLSACPTNALVALTLAITYVPRVVLPAVTFVWGDASAVAVKSIEALMCNLAAQELIVKVGQRNAQLEVHEAALRSTLERTLSGPGWGVVPLDEHAYSRGAPYGYVMTGIDTLQLVLA